MVEQWFVGCNVSHVVTKGTSIQRYLGYSSNLITGRDTTLYFNMYFIIEKKLLEACNFLKLRHFACPTILLGLNQNIQIFVECVGVNVLFC